MGLKELLFWDLDYKYFVYARKIEDEVYWLEEYGTEKEIIEYLEKCAELRDEWLDPDDLTESEEYYTGKINENTFGKYGISDPIYDEIFG